MSPRVSRGVQFLSPSIFSRFNQICFSLGVRLLAFRVSILVLRFYGRIIVSFGYNLVLIVVLFCGGQAIGAGLERFGDFGSLIFIHDYRLLSCYAESAFIVVHALFLLGR